MEAQLKPKLQVLHFLLQNVRFCIDIQHLEKVLPLVLIETIPNSPPYIVGLMNLAGKSVPVIDLAIRLGLQRTESYSLNTPILLCTVNGKTAGLIIDYIIGLADIEPRAIQMHEEFDKSHSPFQYSISLETEVALLVNAEYILDFSLHMDNRHD